MTNTSLSNYIRSKERCYKVCLPTYFTKEEKQKIVMATKLHNPPIMRDFVWDHLLEIIDKVIKENPQIEQELYEHPEKYHPKPGEENIFRPVMINIKIKKVGVVKDGRIIAETNPTINNT